MAMAVLLGSWVFAVPASWADAKQGISPGCPTPLRVRSTRRVNGDGRDEETLASFTMVKQ
jgi:hypothetical protein